jgi:GT2 family glycosyltransferase/glycosyltransferase involved in cell wall biosynthesis
VFVSYNEVIRDPEAIVCRLYEQLTAVGVVGLSLPEPAALQAFIDGSLYREREETEIASYLLPTQFDLSAALKRGASEPKAWPSRGESVPQSITSALQDGERLQQQFLALQQTNRQLELANRKLEATISKSQDVVKTKEVSIEKKDEAIEKKEEAIASRNEALKRKDEVIQAKNEAITKRDKVIASKNEILKRKDESIHKLRQELLTLTASTEWKMATTLSHVYRAGVPAAVRPWVRASAKTGYYFGQDVYQFAKGIQQYRLFRSMPANRTSTRWQNPFSPPQVSSNDFSQLKIDIIVCIHNSLEDVKACLDAVERTRTANTRLIVVNDGSDEETSHYLDAYFVDRVQDKLILHSQALGYTRAANAGLRAATADYAILLNSDTIVPRGWLEKLLEVGESDPDIGIIGPLSNAASWQSIPEVVQANGKDWSVNPLPSGLTVERMAQIVELQSDRSFPRVPLLNGFCYAIKRATIERIGYLDEETFPQGYGEENDYCFRAADAGLSLAIATHAYVYHAKSKSYTHERRRELARLGGAAFDAKHGQQRVQQAVQLMRQDPSLARMRSQVAALLAQLPASDAHVPLPLSVLFLLPVSGGSGGAHSVVQEATGLQKLGVKVKIAVPEKHRIAFEANYFETFPLNELVLIYRNEAQLLAEAQRFDIAVATIFTSVKLLEQIWQRYPAIAPAYYTQDYEPLFDLTEREKQEALQSYTRVPGTVIFAKTQWLQQEIERHHSVRVHRVVPSLDREVFFAAGRTASDRIRITAMVRVSTPRRAPHRTVNILKRIQQTYGDRVEIRIFGSNDMELVEAGIDVESPIVNLGKLSRLEVADLFRNSDLFVDFSEYQAFGRTGVEAMACGVATLLPARGGAGEYAIHNVNSLLVDTSDEAACEMAIQQLVDNDSLLARLQQQGLATASGYSVENAAYSELILFLSLLLNRANCDKDVN